MGTSWTTSVIIILALTGLSWSDSIKPNETISLQPATTTVSATAVRNTTELDKDEYLPEAEPLTGDQDWFDSQKTNGDEETIEDDGTEDEGDDIETAGSELVSTVVKQDENGRSEAGDEVGVRRRRKKGRKRRRRMRKRPRTTTLGPVAESSESSFSTPAPSVEAELSLEKIPIPIPQEEVVSTNDDDGNQGAYPRRRPGRRRKRPWKRPSTEANEPEENPENRQPENRNPENREPEIEAPPLPELPLLDELPSPAPSPSPTPRRRKRPKNRNRVPQETPESERQKSETPDNSQTGESKDTERPISIPDNHKEYKSSTQENKQRDDFGPTIKPKIKNDEGFNPVKPRPQNEDKLTRTQSYQKDLTENNLQTQSEQINQDGHRFNENDHTGSYGGQAQQEQKQTSNKPVVLSTEYPKKDQKPKDYQSFGPQTEQKPTEYYSFNPQIDQKLRDHQSYDSQADKRPKDYQTYSQKPKDYQSYGQQTPQKPRDYQSFGQQTPQNPKDYQSYGQSTPQKPKDFQPLGSQEQKQKDYQSFNPQIEQKPRDYQSFGPQTNRPNNNKQMVQPQNIKFVEPNYSNNEQNRQTSTSMTLPTNVPFRPNEYDGFQQFQKIYGLDPNANDTQLNRLKNLEQTRVGPETPLKQTSYRNQNENTENRQQTNNLPKTVTSNANLNAFINYSMPNRPSEINGFSSYGQGYGHPAKPTLSTLQNLKEIKSDPERPNHFPIYHKQQGVNSPQSGLHQNKQKQIKELDTLSTTYRPPIPIAFNGKPQNENSPLQSRPVENNRQQYAKPQNNEYQINLSPQENVHSGAQRNKANQQQPQTVNNEEVPKGFKSEIPYNRFPSIPQQNILRQISNQNHQFPAQASVIVSDSIETNSAKPQFSYIHDLNGKFKSTQSIDQFNKQLIDPTLLTSPVLFEPPVPPLFEDDLPSTKLTPTKVHLPPITHPKSKLPPAPFLPPSQKQLPNTQFQRQADPAPFKLPQNSELQQTQKVTPSQNIQQNNQSKRNNLPQTSASIQNQSERETDEQTVSLVQALEEQDDDIKSLLPTRNVIQTTTTIEPETTSNYVEPQTTKAASSERITRKPLFSHAKRLPPTSAVIRRKVRPHVVNNLTTTTENTPTTTSNDNRENLSEKYKGKSNRNKNLYRQHLTEVEPTQKAANLEIDQSKNENGAQDIFLDSQYPTVENDDEPLVHVNDQESPKIRRPVEKYRTTTAYPEIVTDSTSTKPGRFGLHHVSAQQEILRQTLKKQGKDSLPIEDNTDPPPPPPPFIPINQPEEESEFGDDFVHESNPTPVFTSSKKTHSFTTQKHSNRQRTHGRNKVHVTTETTPKYTQLEIITDKPEYSAADEYEFMVSDEELYKMMKPMMGDDEERKDSEDLKFKAANIHGVKDEILDLIKTDSGSARLSKILKLRNMSLDDLIKHRERGSSQLHLSEIFPHKKQNTLESTYQPEPTEIYAVPNYSNSQDDVEAEITPIFESNYIKQKGEFERIRNSTSTSTTRLQKNNFSRDNPTDQSDDDKNNREPKVFESMPSFTLRTDILEKINEKVENPQKTDSSWRFFGQISKPERPLRPSFEDVVISYTSTNRYPYRKPTVEEIDDIILLSDTEQYDAPRSNVIHAKVLADSGERKDQEFFTETKKLSSGVKSAIIVSAAIIGIAVLGFFALMISCRIKQKKARLRAQRDILCDHFHEELRSSARSTSPVIPHGPEENTCEHGVRSTAIPTQHYNNRHYYLWRTLRKTFQYE